MSASKCPSIVLSNGVKMPQVGMGVWGDTGEKTQKSVLWALETGYRHIDTASYYNNEEDVGKALKASGKPRKEIFITTKVWNTDHGYDMTLAAFERSRAALDVDYIDLYLIHWPGQNKQSMIETWRALEKLYFERKVRAIGVSNFNIHHIEELLAACKVPPMVNQIELHPLFQQNELRAYCKPKNIVVTAWRPLGKGAFLSHPKILELANKLQRKPSQIIIRWMIQMGIVTIPKSVHKERIEENFDVFDFELDKSCMSVFNSINEEKRIGQDPESFF